MSFKNKVVLVTGASAGIGAAVAVAFAKEGADVAMVGRNETKLAEVEQICANHGKWPLVIKADILKDEDLKRIVETTLDKFGKVDILSNNAGIMELGNILNGELIQAYDKLVAVNLRAIMQLTCLVSPHLIKTKGNIINMSGVGGQRVFRIAHVIPHSVVKAALNQFTLGAALELSAHGVRVNAVSPGPVFTELLEKLNLSNYLDDCKSFTALNRISEAEEVADLVLFLASDKAKGITGANYVCDNGMLLK